jgi:hypothetical protein
METKNCAFQYAKITTGILRNTTLVEDKTSLTLQEAKELWNKYYNDCASWIKDGNVAEMVIWVNMEDANSYNDYLQYISTDAESNGYNIWVTERKNFITY